MCIQNTTVHFNEKKKGLHLIYCGCGNFNLVEGTWHRFLQFSFLNVNLQNILFRKNWTGWGLGGAEPLLPLLNNTYLSRTCFFYYLSTQLKHETARRVENHKHLTFKTFHFVCVDENFTLSLLFSVGFLISWITFILYCQNTNKLHLQCFFLFYCYATLWHYHHMQSVDWLDFAGKMTVRFHSQYSIA